MPRKIDDLYYELRLHQQKFEAEFNNVNKKLDKFGDQAEKQSQRANKAMAGFKKAIIAVAAAVGTIKLGKTFIDAASEAENYRVRLEVLLGSVEEGNRVFRDASEFASKVAFEYSEVVGAATQLATVLNGGSQEIKKFMPLLADIAASTGLTLQQTAEQFTRAMSAGIGAADLFRERGVTAVMGFEAGAKVSIEETRAAFENALTDMDFKFRGAADRLGGTWDGMTSMLSDKWFQFRNEVMANGVFDLLKGEVDALNSSMQDNLIETARATADAFLSVAEAAEMTVAAIEDFFAIIGSTTFGKAFGAGLEFIGDGFNMITDAVKDYAGLAGDFLEEASDAVDGHDSRLKQVEEKYAAIRERVQEYREEQEKATEQQEEYNEAMAEGNEKLEETAELAGKDAVSGVESLKEEMDELSVAGEESIRNIQNAFEDFIGDVLRGEGSIEDFGKTLLSAFSNQAAAGITDAIFGGGGGGSSGLGGLLNAGSSLFSGGSGLASTGFDLGSISSAFNVSSIVGGLQSGTLGNLGVSLGSTLGLGTGGQAFLGNLGLNMPGAGLGSMAAGLLGLSNDDFLVDTAASLSGAAIGTAILPGIGTIVGSFLGSTIGGLFGSRAHPASTFSGTFDESGGINVNELRSKHIGTDVAEDFANSFSDVFGGIFQSLGLNPSGARIDGGMDDGNGLFLTPASGRSIYFNPEDEENISLAVAQTIEELLRFDPALAEQGEELRRAFDDAAASGKSAVDVLDEYIQKLAEEEMARLEAIAALNTELEEVQFDLSQVNSALSDSLSEAQQMAETFSRITVQLQDSLDSMFLGANSTLSPEAQLEYARQAARETSSLASMGNVEAMEKLPSVLDAFLAESREFNASNAAYKADFAFATNALEGAIGTSQRQANNYAAEAEKIRAAQEELVPGNPYSGQSSDQLIAAVTAGQNQINQLTKEVQELVQQQEQARRVAA